MPFKLPSADDTSPDLTAADVLNQPPPLEVADYPGPYLDVEWPTEPFMIYDDADGAAGPFQADEFEQDPETGAYVRSRYDERPRILRVVQAHKDGTIYCVDGDGRTWRYLVVHLNDQ